jgi:hypothetical protein
MRGIHVNKKQGLYFIALQRLEELNVECRNKSWKSDKIIPFPKVFEKLCVTFSIPKEVCWEVLFLLREFGFIEIIPYHGIKLKSLLPRERYEDNNLYKK